MPNVMLCEDLEEKRLHFPSTVSPKYDGVRATYTPGDTYLWSRNNKPIYGMQHIIEELAYQRVGPQDMELIVPNMEFNELSGLIRNHNETPSAIGMIIDCPVPGDLRTRLKLRAQPSDSVMPIPHYVVQSHAHILKYYFDFLKQGHEGIVWKSLGHKYSGRRSYDWMRMVPVKSVDAKVEALYEGEGKLRGLCGGFYFYFNGHLCKCGTMLGITHEERGYMWFDQAQYIGRTAIIEYKELQPSGKPRQPRFKGWRYDK